LQKRADFIYAAAKPAIMRAVDLSHPASDLFITTPQTFPTAQNSAIYESE